MKPQGKSADLLVPRIIAVALVVVFGILFLYLAFALLSWLLNHLFVVAIVVGVVAIIGLAGTLYYLIKEDDDEISRT